MPNQSTSVLYPSTNFKHIEQLVASHGKGVFLYDSKGREYLEAMSGLWCLSLGYGNEELVEAASMQMSTLPYSCPFGGKTHPMMIALAEKIASLVPVPEAKVFFGLGGSDANDTHLKILRYYANTIGTPDRKKILAGSKAYHGVGVGSVALTGLAATHTNFDPPFEAMGVVRYPTPHFYRMAHAGETEQQFSQRMAQELEQLIISEGADTIMAYIAEPVIGAGGVVVPGTEYYRQVQAILKKYNILFIDDEVICGFGRTGADFGATTFDIKPDLMTFAKGLTSGYLPLSAAVVPGHIYDAIVDESDRVGAFGHGYTYSGHPVSCALGLKVLSIYYRDNLFEHAATIGTILQKKLQSLASHPLVGEVRGCGMLGALELVSSKKTKENFPASVKIGLTAQKCCEEEGLIVRGIAGNSVAICPPLVISEQEVDVLFERFERGLDKTLSAVRSHLT